jgi:hypothetical protein
MMGRCALKANANLSIWKAGRTASPGAQHSPYAAAGIQRISHFAMARTGPLVSKTNSKRASYLPQNLKPKFCLPLRIF